MLLTDFVSRTSTDADTELLRLARRDPLPLITWEGVREHDIDNDLKKLRNRAIVAGVEVSPTAYLAKNGVNVSKEAWNFVFACMKAVRGGRRCNAFSNSDILDFVVPMYRFVLLDDVNNDLVRVPRG